MEIGDLCEKLQCGDQLLFLAVDLWRNIAAGGWLDQPKRHFVRFSERRRLLPCHESFRTHAGPSAPAFHLGGGV
jgi:hypothetical protein